MFGRRAARTRGGTPDDSNTLNVCREVALYAEPDRPSIARNNALTLQIGNQLAGGSGYIVGYDRGDPATSLTGAVVITQQPTAAMAQVGRLADQAAFIPTSEFYDMSTTDPSQDPYQSLLFQRIAR